MKTYTLGLDFRKAKGDVPHPPRARVYLARHSSGDGRHYITADCYGPHEFESEIDRLRNELEELKKAARRRFAKEARK